MTYVRNHSSEDSILQEPPFLSPQQGKLRPRADTLMGLVWKSGSPGIVPLN